TPRHSTKPLVRKRHEPIGHIWSNICRPKSDREYYAKADYCCPFSEIPTAEWHELQEQRVLHQFRMTIRRPVAEDQFTERSIYARMRRVIDRNRRAVPQDGLPVLDVTNYVFVLV